MTGKQLWKFGAEKKHERNGNVLIFDTSYLAKMGKIYGETKGIQTKLVVDDAILDINRRDSCDSCDASKERRRTQNKSYIGTIEDNQAQNSDDDEPKKNHHLLQNESLESHDSPRTPQESMKLSDDNGE